MSYFEKLRSREYSEMLYALFDIYTLVLKVKDPTNVESRVLQKAQHTLIEVGYFQEESLPDNVIVYDFKKDIDL